MTQTEHKLDVSKADADQKQQILKYAADVRKFEIERFWQRSLFFWGFIAAAFLAYAALYDRDNLLTLLIACFGVVCSFAWTLQNRGGKYWQEAWEQKVKSVEIDALAAPLFSNREPLIHTGWFGGARFSVSRLAIGSQRLHRSRMGSVGGKGDDECFCVFRCLARPMTGL